MYGLQRAPLIRRVMTDKHRLESVGEVLPKSPLSPLLGPVKLGESLLDLRDSSRDR